MWQSLEILNYFNTLTLMQVFENLLKKKMEYRFLVGSKCTLEGRTKWTYHKQRIFATNYFTFLNI